jgi:hypothetical protein
MKISIQGNRILPFYIRITDDCLRMDLETVANKYKITRDRLDQIYPYVLRLIWANELVMFERAPNYQDLNQVKLNAEKWAEGLKILSRSLVK